MGPYDEELEDDYIYSWDRDKNRDEEWNATTLSNLDEDDWEEDEDDS